MVALTSDRTPRAPRATSDRHPGCQPGDLRRGHPDAQRAGDLIEGAVCHRCLRCRHRAGAQVLGRCGRRGDPLSPGRHRFANSAAGDLITKADIGAACYIVDDQTVARTNGTNTRSPAGVVDAWTPRASGVRFDESLARAVLS